MNRAIAEGADYLGVGPAYATPTKPGKAAAGFDYFRYVADNCPIPWFAIGGIDSSNLDEVLLNGGKRVAVVRAIMQAEEPKIVVQQLLTKLVGSRG
jgi:thiamine-phosphate pyrophosphorylase